MVGWIILLALVCAAIIALYSVILPKYFLKYRYKPQAPLGRGLKVVRDTKGKNIVYEPDRKLKPYIRQYLLSERAGKKCVICRIDENIRTLDYDIVLYDARGKAFKGLHVRETVERAGYSRAVELPDATCYVSLLLNRADEVCFRRDTVKISKGWLAAFLALCVAVQALGFWGLRVCLANSFGGVFAESFLVSASDQSDFILLCAAIAVINLLITWLAVILRNREKNKGEYHRAE